MAMPDVVQLNQRTSEKKMFPSTPPLPPHPTSPHSRRCWQPVQYVCPCVCVCLCVCVSVCLWLYQLLSCGCISCSQSATCGCISCSPLHFCHVVSYTLYFHYLYQSPSRTNRFIHYRTILLSLKGHLTYFVSSLSTWPWLLPFLPHLLIDGATHPATCEVRAERRRAKMYAVKCKSGKGGRGQDGYRPPAFDLCPFSVCTICN